MACATTTSGASCSDRWWSRRNSAPSTSCWSRPSACAAYYGLNLLDPAAYAEVIGIFAVAVGLATLIPARRAVGVYPATTLRCE